jgi:hypothetical protein
MKYLIIINNETILIIDWYLCEYLIKYLPLCRMLVIICALLVNNWYLNCVIKLNSVSLKNI